MEATLWCNYAEVRFELNNNHLGDSHTCVNPHIIRNYALYKDISVAEQKVTFLKWKQFMVCQELGIANLENQKKSEAYQNGFIKSYTYSYHSISLVCFKKSANQSIYV